jgi:GGDEF domain-containing protein
MVTAKRKCQTLAREINAIGLGASFGVAEFDGEESEDMVLHRADMAMYDEKRRNTGAIGDESEER